MMGRLLKDWSADSTLNVHNVAGNDGINGLIESFRECKDKVRLNKVTS